MSYQTSLDGGFSLRPPVEGAAREALLARLAALATSAARWTLSPLGGSLTPEDVCDYRVALEQLATIYETELAPRGIELVGEIRAVGEDGALLAIVRASEGGFAVHEQEQPEPSTAGFLRGLESDDPEMRAAMARALGGRAEPAVIAAFARLLRDEKIAAVLNAALETVGEIGARAAALLGDVVPLLSHADPTVRYWSTFALGRMGPAAASASTRLRALTSDPEHAPRYGAIDALKRIGG